MSEMIITTTVEELKVELKELGEKTDIPLSDIFIKTCSILKQIINITGKSEDSSEDSEDMSRLSEVSGMKKKTKRVVKSGYNLFCSDERANIKKRCPDMKPQAVMKELGKRWKALSDSQKSKWNEKAKIPDADTGKSEDSSEDSVDEATDSESEDEEEDGEEKGGSKSDLIERLKETEAKKETEAERLKETEAKKETEAERLKETEAKKKSDAYDLVFPNLSDAAYERSHGKITIGDSRFTGILRTRSREVSMQVLSTRLAQRGCTRKWSACIPHTLSKKPEINNN